VRVNLPQLKKNRDHHWAGGTAPTIHVNSKIVCTKISDSRLSKKAGYEGRE